MVSIQLRTKAKNKYKLIVNHFRKRCKQMNCILNYNFSVEKIFHSSNFFFGYYFANEKVNKYDCTVLVHTKTFKQFLNYILCLCCSILKNLICVNSRFLFLNFKNFKKFRRMICLISLAFTYFLRIK